jgi:GAF domain-containing protein
MTDNLTPQILVIPAAVFLSHAVLAVVVIARRGLRGREAGAFCSYLAVAAVWFLLAIRGGLRAVWPLAAYERLTIYGLVALSVVFWGFTRAFLQKRVASLAGWLSAAGLLALLIAVDERFISLPPLSLTIGAVTFSEEMLTRFAASLTAIVYACVSLVTVLVEYARRASPLHRNRITYWLFGTTTLVAGLCLVFVSQQIAEFAGTALHWLGAVLLAYVVVQPQLPNIATGVRRAFSYFLASLIPAAVAIGLSLGLVYGLGPSTPLRFQLTDSLVLGVIVAGVVVFLLYRPLSSLTLRVVNRVLFGRSYQAQHVVREYGQAVTQTLSLETLATTAMQSIDGALGIRRGTLLVVEDIVETGWWLRVIEGLNVSADQPRQLIPSGTPLADWLVERGAPLHQYTLDVDPQFGVMGEADRASWRRMGMEVFLPIRHSGKFIGLLALGLRRSGRAYGGAELELLATLADQTAVALENATLFDRVQRRAEQLALLNEIGRVITSSLDLEPAVDLITARIESAFEGATGFIFLLDEEQGDLSLQSSFGRGALADGSFRVRLGEGIAGHVAADASSVLVSDLPADARYAPAVEGVLAPDARSALCVPIITRGKTIGVILLVAPSRTGLGTTELNLLDSIASFASITIENARQVAAREARLRRQVEALQIEIDEMKRARHVEEITDTEYFRQLQLQARQLRQERRVETKKGLFDRLQEEVDKRSSPQGSAPDDETAAPDEQSGSGR